MSLRYFGDKQPRDRIVMPEKMSSKDAISMAFDKHYLVHNLRLDSQGVTALQTFADANGYVYDLTAKPFSYEPQNPLQKQTPAWTGIFNGYSAMSVHTMTGSVQDFPIIMQLCYSTLSGSMDAGSHDSKPLLQTGLIRVTLPKVFPQIVLDSNKNDKSTNSSLDRSFKAGQTLSLEGNFNSYFDLFAPVGLQINTLTVLSPNFMSMIMNSSANFDVELFGNELVLITRDNLYTESVMAAAMDALNEQLSYMRRLLNSWNYTPVSLPFDTLHTTLIQGSSTKIGRLRIGPAAFLVIMGFVFLPFILLALLFAWLL